MENKNCDMCTMPNCISRNLSSKEDCLLDEKLSANDSFDFLEQSLAKFAIDFAYKGKTLKECLDKYKSNIIAAAHTIEPTIPDIVDEHYWEMLGEEPVSEDLGKCTSKIILEGTNFNKSWYAHPELAFKAGAKWQKEQMMAKAVDGVVHRFDECRVASVHYNDPNGVPMAYFIPSEGLSAGDKVKIITIKKK